MGTFRGNEGKVKAGGTFVGEVDDFTLNESVNPIDMSNLNDATDRAAAGSKKWDGTLTLGYDAADPGQTTLVVGAIIALSLLPEGSTAGKDLLSGSALIVTIGVPVKRNAKTMRTISFQSAGDLTHGLVS